VPHGKYRMRFFLFLFVCFSFTTVAANAQEEKSPIAEYLIRRGYSFEHRINDTIPDSLKQWPDTVYYNTVYKAKLLGSPTIPFSFSSIEYVDGQYQVSSLVSIGLGYTWFFGDFIFNENDKITVDPTFCFGLVSHAALKSDFSLKQLGGFFTGAFIGTEAFSLFGGYDFISRSGTIGIGGRIDLYTIHQKSLKPIGKVKEVRKHKSIAQPIRNE
jgi:hypothetical protein